MRFEKSPSGAVSAICDKCARVYDMSSEWDRANLDWHQCQEVFA